LSILKAQSLSKSFEYSKVLDDISFGINSSEICAIIGKSGSGKTTLIRILSGYLLPDSGKVYFNDEVLEGPDVRLVPGYEEIRIVHQDFKLKHKMTVRENIRYELLPYEKDYQDERIAELTALCRIEPLIEKDIALLSGGEKQRVAIARAMATEPEVLIMDEPFSNLDINTKATLLSELKSIAEKTETAIIFITHDARDAMEIAHRMVVLNEGKLANDGSPAQVYANPKHTATANLLGMFNRLNEQQSQELLDHKEGNALWIEDIIPNKGDFAGKISNTVFAGGYNKIAIDFGKDQLWALDHSKTLNIGDQISFGVRAELAFKLED